MIEDDTPFPVEPEKFSEKSLTEKKETNRRNFTLLLMGIIFLTFVIIGINSFINGTL